MAPLTYRPRPLEPRAAPQTAQELLALWRDSASQHVGFGGGCACGADGVVVQLADFEQDIVDYLLAEAQRYDRPDVVGCLEATARRVDGRWSIDDLLTAMDGHHDEAGASLFLLSRLARSLESFGRRHNMMATEV